MQECMTQMDLASYDEKLVWRGLFNVNVLQKKPALFLLDNVDQISHHPRENAFLRHLAELSTNENGFSVIARSNDPGYVRQFCEYNQGGKFWNADVDQPLWMLQK